MSTAPPKKVRSKKSKTDFPSAPATAIASESTSKTASERPKAADYMPEHTDAPLAPFEPATTSEDGQKKKKRKNRHGASAVDEQAEKLIGDALTPATVPEKRVKDRHRNRRKIAAAAAATEEKAPNVVEEVVAQALVEVEKPAKEEGKKAKKGRKGKEADGEPEVDGVEAPKVVEEQAKDVEEAVDPVPREGGKKKRHRKAKKVENSVAEKVAPAPEVSIVATESAAPSKTTDAEGGNKRKRKAKKDEKAVVDEVAIQVIPEEEGPKQKKQKKSKPELQPVDKPISVSSKPSVPPPAPPPTSTSTPATSSQKASSKAATKPIKKPSKAFTPPAPVAVEPEVSDDDGQQDEGGDDGDDMHLRGFSSEEDADSSDEEMVDTGIDVSKLPTIAKDDATVKKKLEKAKRQPTEDRGVIYLGRLPHGFFEDQLKGYFSQFGDVVRVRVSRNKKTGASKHYAFIEFDSSSVAQIVAETMDNYLLMGHIITCKVIPKDEVHPELWVGANRKFRKVPRDRLERVKHDKPRTEQQEHAAEVRLIKRQEERKRKLAEAGIDYNFDKIAYKKPKAIAA